MMAATRNEITKANEWRVYDYVTRHFIASLHENMEYTEKTLIADVNGFHFKYTWHEVHSFIYSLIDFIRSFIRPFLYSFARSSIEFFSISVFYIWTSEDDLK